MSTADVTLKRGADLRSVAAVVPVRSFETAKSRLGEPLDAEERQALVRSMLRRAIRAALDAPVSRVLVVSPDPDALAFAETCGAEPLRQGDTGLNEALAEARETATTGGATALIVLPPDLPALDAAELRRLLALVADGLVADRPMVALVPDRHGAGTNALLVSPPDAIPFRFGESSRGLHAAAARAAGATYLELGGPLALDIDTADDLLLADQAGLDHEAGR